MLNIISCPSPNFNSRDGQEVDMLVLHYTGMKTTEEAILRLCDAEAKVSSHYLIDESGKIYQLVAEGKRAWHAGISYWRGNTNINQRSIGIEIVNCGHEFGYTPFPKKQMQSVAKLSLDIISRHKIPARNVVGHSDIAPTRKQDPGELFDWKWLAQQGIGLFPSSSTNPQPPATLHQYGYDITAPAQTITAFQRHFRPTIINGQWDDECGYLLAGLLEMI